MQWGPGERNKPEYAGNDTEKYAPVKDSDYNQAHVLVPLHTAQAPSS
jgi:hypothetical protein